MLRKEKGFISLAHLLFILYLVFTERFELVYSRLNRTIKQ